MGALGARRRPDRVDAPRRDPPLGGALRRARPPDVTVGDQHPRLRAGARGRRRASGAPCRSSRPAPAPRTRASSRCAVSARTRMTRPQLESRPERRVENPVVGIARGHDRLPSEGLEIPDQLQGALASAAADRRKEPREPEQPPRPSFTPALPRPCPGPSARERDEARSVSATVSAKRPRRSATSRARPRSRRAPTRVARDLGDRAGHGLRVADRGRRSPSRRCRTHSRFPRCRSRPERARPPSPPGAIATWSPSGRARRRPRARGAARVSPSPGRPIPRSERPLAISRRRASETPSGAAPTPAKVARNGTPHRAESERRDERHRGRRAARAGASTGSGSPGARARRAAQGSAGANASTSTPQGRVQTRLRRRAQRTAARARTAASTWTRSARRSASGRARDGTACGRRSRGDPSPSRRAGAGGGPRARRGTRSSAGSARRRRRGETRAPRESRPPWRSRSGARGTGKRAPTAIPGNAAFGAASAVRSRISCPRAASASAHRCVWTTGACARRRMRTALGPEAAVEAAPPLDHEHRPRRSTPSLLEADEPLRVGRRRAEVVLEIPRSAEALENVRDQEVVRPERPRRLRARPAASSPRIRRGRDGGSPPPAPPHGARGDSGRARRGRATPRCARRARGFGSPPRRRTVSTARS